MSINFKHKKLIILDRDGVVNQDSPNYVKSSDEWLPIPGSLAAIKNLNDAGKIVAVATNQSGIARGLFTEETLQAMHEKFAKLLTEQGGKIDAIIHCPHSPDDSCDCRKPKSGMILNLLKQFNVEAKDALMIGDSYRDLQAAWNANVDAVLVKTGKGEKTLAELSPSSIGSIIPAQAGIQSDIFIYDNLLDVARAMIINDHSEFGSESKFDNPNE